MKKTLSMALCLSALVTGTSFAEVPDRSVLGNSDPAMQINRNREYMERERVARQIQEDKAREKSQVEADKRAEEAQSGAEVKFTLEKIEFDKSDILTDEEIAALTKDYLEKEISLKDLYEMVNKTNDLYASKGYITCRAFVPAQTITKGVVHITLVEGKVGDVKVVGNKSTRNKYITNRVGLDHGSYNSIRDLNADLLRFNATNDAQLRIAMQAGKEEGTTDYIISVIEPKQHSVNFYVDNAGSKSSGEVREGLFYTNKSLLHRRDSLALSTIRSEGNKSGSVAYTTNVGRSGTKLGLNYSNNSVHIVKGALKHSSVRGHSSALGLSMLQPLVTTEKTRSELSFDYSNQASCTDFVKTPWIDDKYNNFTLGYSLINYGNSHFFYQRHGFKYSNWENIDGKSRGLGKYTLNAMYQKAYTAGQSISTRFDAQVGMSNYLSSAEQFYIGGAYSVRGYDESFLSGDSGYCVSVEYAVPLNKKKTANIFTFLDYGKVLGDNTLDDSQLIGTGIGVRASVGKNVGATFTAGIPLVKDVNSSDISSCKLHFMVNGTF